MNRPADARQAPTQRLSQSGGPFTATVVTTLIIPMGTMSVVEKGRVTSVEDRAPSGASDRQGRGT